MRIGSRWIGALLLAGLVASAALGSPPALRKDAEPPAPAPDAAAGPPSMAAIAFHSQGAILNGLVYRAAGAGPHPVALFLHGFPGNEKNLDLAQAVRRAGWDAIYFDYRGSWGSGGTFSFGGSLEDVAAVLVWIRNPENAAAHHFDPSRLAIVGHSFGGWLALLSAREQPANVCVAVMAAWNLGWLVHHREDAPAEWSLLMSDLVETTDPAGAPLHADPETLRRELLAAPAGWDYLTRAAALADRPLLLVAATRDSVDEDPAMHERLAAAVRAAGGRQVRGATLDDDHAFSASRLDLAERLTSWLIGDCARHHAAVRR